MHRLTLPVPLAVVTLCLTSQPAFARPPMQPMTAFKWANVQPGDTADAVAVNPLLPASDRVEEIVVGLRHELEHPMPDGFLWSHNDSAIEQRQWISRLARIGDVPSIYAAWENAADPAVKDRLVLAITGTPEPGPTAQQVCLVPELVRIMRSDAPLWVREQAATLLPIAANADDRTRALAAKALQEMLRDGARRPKGSCVVVGYPWEYPVRNSAANSLRWFGVTTKARGRIDTEEGQEWDIVPPAPGSKPSLPDTPWRPYLDQPTTLCTLLGQRGFQIRRDDSDNALVATRGSEVLRVWPNRKEAEWLGKRFPLEAAPYVDQHLDLLPDVRERLLARTDAGSPGPRRSIL